MPQNLFGACRVNGRLVAKRVRLDNDVQGAVENVFREQEEQFRRGVEEEVEFDGSWKPDDNEVLVVDTPDDARVFFETIEANAVAIPDLDTARFDQEGIRALFTGVVDDGATKVLIQQFSGRQVLSRRFSLLQHGNAFRRLSDSAFTFDSSLTCIAEEGRLKFKSFHKMRAIVDLSGIYRAATDQEVRNFADHASFEVARPEEFLGQADQTVRRLVHAITDSGTLETYGVDDIQAAAAAVEMPVTVADGKIVMPTERRAIKTFLHFLDDGLYRASLTGQRYVTNSKRPA